MSERISSAIAYLRAVMKEEGVNPTQGLPNELFNFATSLIPCSNVDLFITAGDRLLLSWRDDEFFNKGWHIPGGCLRLKETLDYRIQQTAINEIGSMVNYKKDGFITREVFFKREISGVINELERSHNISMLFFCTLPVGFVPIVNDESLPQNGDLRWFNSCPDNLLKEHRELYGDIIDGFFKNGIYEEDNK